MNLRMCHLAAKPSFLLPLGLAMLAPPVPAQTASVVRVLLNPSAVVLGQNATITAGVNWTAAEAPSGTITLTDSVVCPGASNATVAALGQITLGSAASATPGAGTLVVSSFPCVGANSIVAQYSGDSNYLAGSSQPQIETVLAQFTPTTTTLTASANPSQPGQNVTYVARLAYTRTAGTYPTGSVTLTDTSTGTLLGTAKVQTSGAGQFLLTSASLTIPSLPAGSYPLQAAYSGDSIYSPSTSPILNQASNGTGMGAPSIPAGGVVTASQFGDSSSIAPATWIEIYGTNLAIGTRTWTSADFHGVNAPTSLDGTSLTIGGQPAFVSYISPGQVNAQVPSNVAPGSQLLVLTTPAGSTAGYSITVNATEPGLLAPSAFVIGGNQYVAALFLDGATFVLPPGAVSGVTSQRAKPGDTITLYGIGFGPVLPDTPAGQIVQQTNRLATSFDIAFGGVSASVQYAGLAPQSVGLYQFNVVVPQVAASDTVPLTFTLGGAAGTQTLYIAVQN